MSTAGVWVWLPLLAVAQAPAQQTSGQTPAAATPAALAPAELQRAIDLYWDGEYEGTLALLAQGELDADDRAEGLKYAGFSLVALGRNDDARQRFRALLEADPAHALDTSLVSPKIVEQFEQAKGELSESLFERGKAAYFDADYDTAYDLLEARVKLGPPSPIASEYLQLAQERIDLEQRTTQLEAEVAAAAPPDPDRIYNIGGEVSDPQPTSQSPPRYHPLDLRSRTEGEVILRLVIDRQGRVTEATVMRGLNARLDNEAMRAARRWRYRPAMRNGEPVSVYKIVAVRFTMRR